MRPLCLGLSRPGHDDGTEVIYLTPDYRVFVSPDLCYIRYEKRAANLRKVAEVSRFSLMPYQIINTPGTITSIPTVSL